MHKGILYVHMGVHMGVHVHMHVRSIMHAQMIDARLRKSTKYTESNFQYGQVWCLAIRTG